MVKKVLLILSIVLCCSTIAYPSRVNAITNENLSFSSQISDTDVLKGLNIQKENLETYLLTETNVNKIQQLQELLQSTNEMIAAYSLKQIRSVQPRASWFIEVSAVVGWFNLKGYSLSAELLTHAKDNTKIDSLYEPYYKSIVQYSPVWRNLSDSSSTKGSSVFPNSGNKYCIDLYYAIHKFSWTKNSTTTSVVHLYDRYDFSYGDRYSGLAGVAVNSMYSAQQDGYLKPFKVEIVF